MSNCNQNRGTSKRVENDEKIIFAQFRKKVGNSHVGDFTIKTIMSKLMQNGVMPRLKLM